MKKGLYILCVAVAAVLFTGCGSGEETKEIEIRNSFTGFSQAAVSETVSVYVEDGLLHMYDAASGKDMVLCSRADCSHEPYDELSNPDPVCEAALNEQLFFSCIPVLCGRYIYLFGQEDLQRGVVYRENLDGSGREKRFTFDYQVAQGSYVYVRDGQAVMTASLPVVREDEVGGSGTNESYKTLLRMDLDSGDTESVSGIDREGRYQYVRILSFRDGDVYYAYSWREARGDETDMSRMPEHTAVFCCHGKDGKKEEVWGENELTGYQAEGICGGKLYAIEEKTGDAYEIPRETGERKLVYASADGKAACFVLGDRWIVEEQNGSSYSLLEDDGTLTGLPQVSSILDSGEDMIVYMEGNKLLAAKAEPFLNKRGDVIFQKEETVHGD